MSQPKQLEPTRLTYNMMRNALWEAACYPGLDPNARLYPGKPCTDHSNAEPQDLSGLYVDVYGYDLQSEGY